MIIFIKLLLAHLIGDFVLQSQTWVQQKEKKRLGAWQLYVHAVLHGVLSLLLLWDAKYWSLALAVILVHGLIDALKLYAQRGSNKTRWFIVDQVLHLISLAILTYCWGGIGVEKWKLVFGPGIWVYLVAIFFLAGAMPIVMRILLLKYSNNIGLQSDASLGNAGKYIGILERLLVFTFIIVGHWEAVGFLITAKSVFRFIDLKESKDRKLTEYILIGTLLSFGIAIVTALLTQFAMVFI